MKKHFISGNQDKDDRYEWILAIDSDGDPIIKINGKIILWVNRDGSRILYSADTIKNLRLSIDSTLCSHSDDI